MKISIAIVLLTYNLLLAKAERSLRIIDGFTAKPGQFPWQVAIKHRNTTGVYLCGGSLINQNWVLTAAHCVDGISDFTLFLGGITLSSKPEAGRETRTAKVTIQHPNYNPKNKNNDIALIGLNKPVRYTSKIKAVALSPINFHVENGVKVRMSGWGKTSGGSTTDSKVLRYVDLFTIDNEKCVESYDDNIIKSSTLCTVGNPNSSPCGSDSGGPLVQYLQRGNVMQIGVASFTHKEGCAVGHPAGYIRVASFRKWIKDNTGV